MQIQIISSYDEMQNAFNQMLKDAISQLPTPEATPEPILMTGEQLSKKLDITIQTLIRWRQKGKIPFLQIGSSIRYDLNKVLNCLEDKKKGAKKW